MNTSHENLTDTWNANSDDYNRYSKEGLEDKKELEAWKSIMKEVFGDSPLKILDIGTGPGTIAIVLSEMGHEVTALDFSDSMLSHARANASARGAEVAFVKGDAADLPFSDNSFDAVISRNVLWTLPDPVKALTEWKRVISPDGKLTYIDGDWSNELNKSVKTRFKHLISSFLIRVTQCEHVSRIQATCGKDLWSVSAERPAFDLNILNGLDLKDIRVSTGIDQRVYSGLRAWKYGYYSGTFLVECRK